MNRIKNRLGTELIAAVLISLISAFLLYTLVEKVTTDFLDDRTQSYEYYKRQQDECAVRLQKYVDDHGITLSNLKPIDNWIREEEYVSVLIWYQNELVYTSYPAEEDMITDSEESGGAVREDYSVTIDIGDQNNTINFPDGSAQTMIFSYLEYRYYQMAKAFSYLFSSILFVVVFLWLIRRKTTYIEQLKDELQVLEGGNLEYQVTVKGSDELGELAEGIERMRRSIIERDAAEKAARKANQELVTAMSHDLRSPLTSLLGYLELLDQDECDGEEQRKHFISTSHKKVIQIKEMSDRLFEYFLVYGKDEEEIELEEVDAMALLEQTVLEEIYHLECKGYEVRLQLEPIDCRLPVNVDLFRRVTSNIFSNITKYADKKAPVTITVQKEADILTISFCNKTTPSSPLVESSGIGLKTCRKIMEEHGGRFEIRENNNSFSAALIFPTLLPVLKNRS